LRAEIILKIMSDIALLKPLLYQREGTSQAPKWPALLGGVCRCGHVFFPMQHYGCTRCGTTDLKSCVLSGQGTLIASVLVHMHHGKHRQAPFTVASVRLDDGPLVRTLILDELPSGSRVVTTLVPVLDAEGVEHLDLRFTALPASEKDR
jgi:uncharacterized OB-fold protein